MPNQRTRNNRRTNSSHVNGIRIDTHGLSTGFVIATLAFLIVGIVVGGFVMHFLTQKDCFEMVPVSNATNLEISADGSMATYSEPGAKCVAFGKDISATVKVAYLYREDITCDTQKVDKIDADVAGIYYAVYTVDNFKYRNVQLVRSVVVLRTEE